MRGNKKFQTWVASDLNILYFVCPLAILCTFIVAKYNYCICMVGVYILNFNFRFPVYIKRGYEDVRFFVSLWFCFAGPPDGSVYNSAGKLHLPLSLIAFRRMSCACFLAPEPGEQ